MVSKWANDEQDAADAARRKQEKEAKKRAKAERQRQQQAANENRHQHGHERTTNAAVESSERPQKRRRLSGGDNDDNSNNNQPVHGNAPTPLLRFETGTWTPSRSIDEFEILNPIEEGTYGHVSRARDKTSGEIVALKKMKLEGASSHGIPVTVLREIQTLRHARHRHIIQLNEVLTSSSSSDGVSSPSTVLEIHLSLEFASHDLKTLLASTPRPFTPSEVKSLLLQLSSALAHLHSHLILHRDLKTSNILLLASGRLKLADFGMARFTSTPPPPNLTGLVVTLWYRAPELLLGATRYGPEIDMWSLGCVFAELLEGDALLQGRNEVDQLGKIFQLMGLPDEKSWPGWRRLPNAKTLRVPSGRERREEEEEKKKGSFKARFEQLTRPTRRLLQRLLRLCPERRWTAEEVLECEYFVEDPKPKREDMFPTFPSKAGGERRRRSSPDAPVRGAEQQQVDFGSLVLGSSGPGGSQRWAR